jgi:hypothetical protein
MLHDVVENTYRKNVAFRPLHDVNENTGTYGELSTMLMKTREKSFMRGSETELGPGGQKRLRDIMLSRDVKNEDRSHDVYENKGTHDTMTENKNDFVSENASISQNIAVCDGQLGCKISFVEFSGPEINVLPSPKRQQDIGNRLVTEYNRAVMDERIRLTAMVKAAG